MSKALPQFSQTWTQNVATACALTLFVTEQGAGSRTLQCHRKLTDLGRKDTGSGWMPRLQPCKHQVCLRVMAEFPVCGETAWNPYSAFCD